MQSLCGCSDTAVRRIPTYYLSDPNMFCTLSKPEQGDFIMQVASGTLALLVAALMLFPDKQPAIMTVLLMLLIEVNGLPSPFYKSACSGALH